MTVESGIKRGRTGWNIDARDDISVGYKKAREIAGQLEQL